MRSKEAFAYSRSTEYFCSVVTSTVRVSGSRKRPTRRRGHPSTGQAWPRRPRKRGARHGQLANANTCRLVRYGELLSRYGSDAPRPVTHQGNLGKGKAVNGWSGSSQSARKNTATVSAEPIMNRRREFSKVSAAHEMQRQR